MSGSIHLEADLARTLCNHETKQNHEDTYKSLSSTHIRAKRSAEEYTLCILQSLTFHDKSQNEISTGENILIRMIKWINSEGNLLAPRVGGLKYGRGRFGIDVLKGGCDGPP